MSGPEPIEAIVTDDGRALVVIWSDGLREALPAIWLRDNADDAFDAPTGQRRLGLGALFHASGGHIAGWRRLGSNVR